MKKPCAPLAMIAQALAVVADDDDDGAIEEVAVAQELHSRPTCASVNAISPSRAVRDSADLYGSGGS